MAMLNTFNCEKGQKNHLRNIRFVIRLFLEQYPRLYFSLLHIIRSPRRFLHVRRDTEIVIEGYPRSANTFAVAAFLIAQKRPVRIARHLHASAQVIQAVKWNIPTIVLIRNPEDAVLSLLVREPVLSVQLALKSYIRFYTRIIPYQHGFVLATFEEVIHDFGAVIERVNQRFCTSFDLFKPTRENLNKVFRLIEEMDKSDQGRTKVTETTVARPSIVRKKMKNIYKAKLTLYTNLLDQAKSIYETFCKNFC